MIDVPPGFRLYADVLMRFADIKACGNGVRFRCPFRERHKHGDRNWSGNMWIGTHGDLAAKCMGCQASRKELVEWSGLPETHWWPNKGKRHEQQQQRVQPMREVATYDYRDADGQLLFQKVRFEPKTFLQRRPLTLQQKQAVGAPMVGQAWAWGLKAGVYAVDTSERGWNLKRTSHTKPESANQIELAECSSVLYRLPELLSADPAQPVLVTEGEKCADNLAQLGFVTTCGSGGASVWNYQWAAHLSGRRVWVIADNDEPGIRHALEIVASLAWAEAKTIAIVMPSQAGDYAPGIGGDMTDWIKDVKKFRSIAEARAAVIALCRKTSYYSRG